MAKDMRGRLIAEGDLIDAPYTHDRVYGQVRDLRLTSRKGAKPKGVMTVTFSVDIPFEGEDRLASIQKVAGPGQYSEASRHFRAFDKRRKAQERARKVA